MATAMVELETYKTVTREGDENEYVFIPMWIDSNGQPHQERVIWTHFDIYVGESISVVITSSDPRYERICKSVE